MHWNARRFEELAGSWLFRWRRVTAPCKIDGVDTDEYKSQVQQAVERAVVLGASDVRQIARLCSGADPSRIDRAVQRLGLTPLILVARHTEENAKAAAARRRVGEFIASLPDANPEYSQWWYSIDGVERLCRHVYMRTGAKALLLIGASTVAPYYSTRFDAECHALDLDEDIVGELGRLSSTITATQYDVALELPALRVKPAAVVVDPPWYSPTMEQFVGRAAQAVENGGYVFCTIPGELTRPNVLEQRNQFLKDCTAYGLTLKDTHVGAVEYTIPPFESVAFGALGPWRNADLAVFQKMETGQAPTTRDAANPVETFRRVEQRFRLFLDPHRVSPRQASPLVRIPKYSETVSRRDVDTDTVALWTSTKVGFSVRDADIARRALQAWTTYKTFKEALAHLASDDSAHLFLKSLREEVPLPDDTTAVRRTAAEIAKRRNESLSEWAEREPSRNENDGYRPTFARDRDRILWSNGLRQLANKTQVFATSHADEVRQRLTHSIEVMQLASTIGSSLGLDRDLVEAGALSHDIGHTPFGHAGEVALSRTLNTIAPGALSFNHYEHGLDVVRWLEDAYRHPSNGGKFGLELSPAVLECIIKHTFCYGDGGLSQRHLLAETKHSDLVLPGPCHLEGQAVRAADKVSYLISDLEDGLRLGAISIEDLRACRLFRHAPIDLGSTTTEDSLTIFLSQRRSIIGVLMQDLIDETARRLVTYGSKAEIKTRDGYTVDHSDTIRVDVSEVWMRIQAGKIHNDPRVISRNRRSARIVSRLLMMFILRPELVDPAFRMRHLPLRSTKYMEWYRNRVALNGFSIPVGVPEELALHVMIGYDRSYQPTIDDVVQSKDYVASMTDQQAERIYSELLGV